MQFQEHLGEKFPKCFRVGPLLSKCPSSTNTPPGALKKLLLYTCESFCKMLDLKCLTVFGIRPCLDNCTVPCTVTICMYCLRHIQNSAAVCIFKYVPAYSIIFVVIKSFTHIEALLRHIQNLIQHLYMQKAEILGILEYSKLFHNCIPPHIQNCAIFTKIHELTYLEPSQRFKIEFFAKIVKNYNYFSKMLHFGYLAGF